MGEIQTGLDLLLALLLAATLFFALRLERALRQLKRDQSALETLRGGFNDSTREAEGAIARLRALAADITDKLARQTHEAATVKDDLGFLADRADQLADRLQALLRQGRALAPEPPPHLRLAPDPAPAPAPPPAQPAPQARVRSQAERDLLHALKAAR